MYYTGIWTSSWHIYIVMILYQYTVNLKDFCILISNNIYTNDKREKEIKYLLIKRASTHVLYRHMDELLTHLLYDDTIPIYSEFKRFLHSHKQ